MEGSVRETQLFNLKDNPNELLIEHHQDHVISKTGNIPKSYQVNLAKNPKYSNQLKKMQGILLREMSRLKDPYRLWDQPKSD